VLDLASESIDLLSREISRSGTVVVNGPAGLFEEEQFAVGTYSLLKAASTVEFSVVGGGILRWLSSDLVLRIGFRTSPPVAGRRSSS